MCNRGKQLKLLIIFCVFFFFLTIFLVRGDFVVVVGNVSLEEGKKLYG